MIVKFLDWVYVFSGLICDTAKNVEESISKGTWTMIMPPNIQIGNFKDLPLDISVIHLAFELWLVLLFPRACNHDELFSKPTGRMPVSRISHFVLLHEFVVIRRYNLEKTIQRFFILLKVTASNNIKLTFWTIYSLKIVSKLIWLIYADNTWMPVLKLDLEYLFWVFL